MICVAALGVRWLIGHAPVTTRLSFGLLAHHFFTTAWRFVLCLFVLCLFVWLYVCFYQKCVFYSYCRHRFRVPQNAKRLWGLGGAPPPPTGLPAPAEDRLDSFFMASRHLSTPSLPLSPFSSQLPDGHPSALEAVPCVGRAGAGKAALAAICPQLPAPPARPPTCHGGPGPDLPPAAVLAVSLRSEVSPRRSFPRLSSEVCCR